MGGGSAEGNTMKHLCSLHGDGGHDSRGARRRVCNRRRLSRPRSARSPRWGLVTVSNLMSLPVHIVLRRESVDVALGTVTRLSSRTFDGAPSSGRRISWCSENGSIAETSSARRCGWAPRRSMEAAPRLPTARRSSEARSPWNEENQTGRRVDPLRGCAQPPLTTTSPM